MTRRTISKSTRKRVFERDGGRCVFCGTTEPLELAYLVPVSPDDDATIDNLITCCPNCHTRLKSSPVRGFEFEAFVETLLRKSPHYSDVVRESLLPNTNVSVDVVATRAGDNLVIECRSTFAFVNRRFTDVLNLLGEYARHAPGRKVILATLGELTDEQKNRLSDCGYEHWGPRFFAETFSNELGAMADNFIANLIKFSVSNETRATRANSFRKQLLDCPPGKSHWSIYQRLIGNLLEAFFVPPLENTIIECSDEYQVNRRDFVLPNYCTEGFWEFLRQQYSADYVVVDAKNYTSPIKKKEVLQIANYLKKHGTGLFAIIFSRAGAGNSARITLREQWLLYGKLIVVLSDDDVLAMLTASASGGQPDSILRQRIEEFRLRM